jgi:hypothetical protein
MAVLRGCGLSDGEIDALVDSGALLVPAAQPAVAEQASAEARR